MTKNKQRTLVSGTPAAWEASALWRADSDPGDSPNSSFEEVCSTLEKSLDAWLNSNGLAQQSAYLRGDLLGDKTQYLYVRNWRVLTEAFLHACRDWLNAPLLRSWRIAIPTSKSSGLAIMIYPAVIRFYLEDSLPLPLALKEIVQNSQDQ